MKKYISSGKWVRQGYDSFLKVGDKFYLTSEEDPEKAATALASQAGIDVSNKPFCLTRYTEEGRTVLSHKYGWTDEEIARTVFFIYDSLGNRKLWGINDDNIIDIRTE